MISENPLSPTNFLAFHVDARHYSGAKEKKLGKAHLLPDMGQFFTTPTFANVAFGWHKEGLFFTIYSTIAPREVFFPDFQKGDSIELFIDTRAMKSSRFPTRFCHHFCFLPLKFDPEGENIEGVELSRFRQDDAHVLADPSLFYVEGEKEKKGYVLKIFIPTPALFGYDPSQFDRLGFTYRINCFRRNPQYFSCSGDEIAIEQHPSCWATLKLVS